jgi:hypothetical protein
VLKNLRAIQRNVGAQFQQLTLAIQQLQVALKRGTIRDTAAGQQQLTVLEQQMSDMQTGIDRMQQLDQVMAALHDTAILSLRVFADADTSEVDLLHVGAQTGLSVPDDPAADPDDQTSPAAAVKAPAP